MISHDLRNAIYAQLDSLMSGSMWFYGHCFGRPFDNIHRIAGAYSQDDVVVIYFDQGENVTVIGPQEWTLPDGRLLIRRAECVRWQWFYYGELPSRESLRFQEYRWVDDKLAYSTDFMPNLQPELDPGRPAVELIACPGNLNEPPTQTPR